MTRQLIIIALLAIGTVANAQKVTDYRIVKVVGVVEDQVTKTPLKTGDVIPSNRQLKFDSRTSYIVVSSPETGRRKISGVPDNQSRELLELFQSFVQPDVRSTMSRSITKHYLERLEVSLKYDSLLILSPSYIPIDTSSLKLSKPAIVRAWYYVGKDITYKRASDATSILLDKATIFGTEVPKKRTRVILEYFTNEKDNPADAPGIHIASFIPKYANEDAIAEEVRSLVSAQPAGTSNTLTFDHIWTYLYNEYAPTQEDNLRQWLHAKGILSR